MLGIASRNVVPREIFADFQKLAVTGKSLPALGEGHQDGWGIAGYLGGWTVHFGRSERSALEDGEGYTRAWERGLLAQSRMLLAHMRKASEGSRCVENSHPFICNEWIFCHNGTIYDSERLIVPRFTYEGTTDSERFFKFLVSRLDRRSVREFPDVIRTGIADLKKKCAYSSLSFLLSNGNYLIGYRDYTGDEDYYTIHYSCADDLSFMFCSEPLPGYAWEPMKNGELVMVHKYGGISNEF
jgi:glutamine amidotransferase